MVVSRKPAKKPTRKKRTPKKAAPKKPATTPMPVPQQPADKIKMTPAPQAGKKITDFEESLEAAIAQEPKPERGGKRPGAGRKAKPMPAETDRIRPAEIGSAIEQFLKIPFDLWAAKAKLPELSLTDEEANTAARPTMILLEYYAPNLGEIAIAWASLAVVTAAIMRPRIMILKKLHSATERPSGTGAGESPAPASAGRTTGFPTDEQVRPQTV